MIIYKKYEEEGALHWKSYDVKEGYRKWLHWIIGQFPDQGNIIELGCGDGVWTAKLKDKGLDAVGVDSSELGISLARAKANDVQYYVVSLDFIADTVFHDWEFDYCLATEIIEHIDDPKDVEKIFRYCVKEFMILTTPDYEHSKHKGSRYHVKEYTEAEMREIFSGYKVERLVNPELTGEFNTNEIMVFKISK